LTDANCIELSHGVSTCLMIEDLPESTSDVTAAASNDASVMRATIENSTGPAASGETALIDDSNKIESEEATSRNNQESLIGGRDNSKQSVSKEQEVRFHCIKLSGDIKCGVARLTDGDGSKKLARLEAIATYLNLNILNDEELMAIKRIIISVCKEKRHKANFLWQPHSFNEANSYFPDLPLLELTERQKEMITSGEIPALMTQCVSGVTSEVNKSFDR